MPQKIKKGHRFGDWKLKKLLGSGGNGVVWLSQNLRGEEGAIKILSLNKVEESRRAKMYARFKSEVKVINENGDIQGILPIIDYYLPDEFTDCLPWYAMPVASTLDEHLHTSDYESVVQAVIEIGEILIELHERGISHRDIKPANILAWKNELYLSDFGLAEYPEKTGITKTGEQIGARWTIAPEMQRNGKISDGKPADVYSLSKTLWILLTSNKTGFEGQYIPESINGLYRFNIIEKEPQYVSHFKPSPAYIKPLDDLLRASTDDNPFGRPNIQEFVNQLSVWLGTHRKLEKRNLLQWQDFQKNLFPISLPQHAFWSEIDEIVEILNRLGGIDSLTHMLFPSRGGLDLLGAKLGLEPGTIELVTSESGVEVVMPKRLIFESFGHDSGWNYFRLETGGLEPMGVVNPLRNSEHMIEVSPLEYISESDWYGDMEKTERKYPNTVRRINRFTEGVFLIVQKRSLYNRSNTTYDGRHNKMDSEEFRVYILDKVNLFKQYLGDEKILKDAANKGLSEEELKSCISEYIIKVINHDWQKFRVE